MHEPHKNASGSQPGEKEESGTRAPSRMESAPPTGYSEGGSNFRSEIGRSEAGHGGGAGRELPPKDVHSVPDGHRPRVPAPVPLRDFEAELYRAFSKGDPEGAYLVASDLLFAYQAILKEVAQLRFRVNFASPVCENCEGLRAGPGIAATCYQVRQCNYTNIKENQSDPRVLRVIQSFSGT